MRFVIVINIYFVVIEEGGVKMKLTVVDTPGFGDQINNDYWWVLCDLSVKDGGVNIFEMLLHHS